MSEELVFTSYAVFRCMPGRLDDIERAVVAKEVAGLFEQHAGRVDTRGIYSTVGLRADADLVFGDNMRRLMNRGPR
jgi:chlorite dismutase